MHKSFAHLEPYRRTDMSFNHRGHRAGVFQIPANATEDFIVIAHDGVLDIEDDPVEPGKSGWEHVSVRVVGTLVLSKTTPKQQRVPSWPEMCAIKQWFWPPDEWVVQFHPSEKEYSNQHPHVLHLWRPVAMEFPHPSADLVGLVTGPEPATPLPSAR
jgi:hypothetical protein